MTELIDRQSALEIATSYCPDDDGCCSKSGHDLREMLDEIEALPVTKAKPVQCGHWIPVDGEPYAKCSYCGEKHYGCATPYCDMCGSYMRKDGVDSGD